MEAKMDAIVGPYVCVEETTTQGLGLKLWSRKDNHHFASKVQELAMQIVI